MKFPSRHLSKKALAQLQRARAIELSVTGRNICGIDDFKDTLPMLHECGLVDIAMVTVDEKEVLCVYITRSGITFLESYKEDPPLENKNRDGVKNWLLKKYSDLVSGLLQNQ